MLKIDRLTSIHSQGQYVRICVEIDIEQPLKSFILIRGHKLLLEFEGLHLTRFHCGRYGHKSSQCAELFGSDKGKEKVQESISEKERRKFKNRVRQRTEVSNSIKDKVSQLNQNDNCDTRG